MYFNEWNLISYRDIYDIFNKSSEQNTTSVNRNFDTRLYQKTHENKCDMVILFITQSLIKYLAREGFLILLKNFTT